MLEQVMLPELTRRIRNPVEATELLRLLSEVLAQPTGLAASTLEQAFSERLRRGGVATAEGVAFPHAVIAGVRKTCVGLLHLPAGIRLDPSQPPSDLVFAIAGDAARPWEHVRLLARLSRIAVDESARRLLREAPDDATLLQALLQEDARHG